MRTTNQTNNHVPAINQTPIHVLRNNDPMNSQKQPENKINSSRRRQSIFESNQKYDQKEILSSRNRSYLQSKPPNQERRKSAPRNENCCSPILLGVLGFLAFSGLVTVVLLSFLNGPHFNNLKPNSNWAEEEDGFVENSKIQEGKLNEVTQLVENQVRNQLVEGATPLQLQEAKIYNDQKEKGDQLESALQSIENQVIGNIRKQNNIPEDVPQNPIKNDQKAQAEQAKQVIEKIESQVMTSIQKEEGTSNMGQNQHAEGGISETNVSDSQ